MVLGKSELKVLGESGIIAGPGESEKQFVRRIDIVKKVEKRPAQFLHGGPFEKWSVDSQEDLGARPTWLPLTYSNRKLLFWQGAAMWIVEGPAAEKIPMIQLRTGFKKGKYFRYSKEEVLLHEALHALRICFDEPRFEEVLAYRCAKSKWRRFFGPLFRYPSQALFFAAGVGISSLLQITSFLFLSSSLLPYVRLVILFPFFDLLLRVAILVKDQRLVRKTLRKLAKIFPNQKNFFPILIRLSDAEIQNFATDSVENILSYIEQQGPLSLRWRQILAQFC